ncbi:cytochrome P450 [Pseudooctadecabacter sp.]|uniref:cytochrome P450 n=1 Tax=Pseudooctadecabacter sp. TaxID=1966338 RepID=UPI0035C82BE6
MGAQDNIASAAGWVLAFLAHHPQLQDQIGDEIADKGSQAPANQPRILTQPIEISGHRLPKGTFIFNSFFNMHHDPLALDAPDRFDPARFRTDAPSKRVQYAPFGHGPRNCVAQSMATQQLSAIVFGMLKEHRIAALDDAMSKMTQMPFLIPEPFQIMIQRQ